MEKINKYGDGSNNKELVITDKFGNVKSIFQRKITLTTTGSTGPATFVNNILNIPEYSSALTGYVPTSRRLEINGISYDLSADRSWSVGTVTSVGVSMPSAFTVTNSPITSSGTIAITGAGTTAEYIDGTGALRPFPSLTGYVPYIGATQDVDLGVHQLKADSLAISTTSTEPVSIGEIVWNSSDGTFDMGLLNGVTLQAGQEMHFYAKADEAITNGDAIQFAGAQGDHLLIKKAVPSEINANPEYFVGVATQDFARNDFGYVTAFGKVRDLNTLAYPEGTVLYFASAGSTSGELTATEPSAPYAKIIVAAVVRSHGTQGTLLVRPHVMPKIEKLQDVNVTGVTSGQVLTYNGSIWVPTTPTTGTVTSVTASAPLSSSGGSTPNITISQASGTDDGYLSSADWSTFNSKQPAGNYITALSGEATGSGPGTASVTLNNASVTAKVLTGVNITGGSISASDSILTAFGKLQNQINGLIGSSIYQGTWNASTNTPALASGVGTRGYYYIVNVAGSTNLDGITDWNVGDWAIFDGTAWQQVDNTDSVTSVNGQTGAVSLTTDNIPEGAINQYFTQLRARQSLTLSTIGSSGAATYDNTTGVLNIPVYTDQYVGTVTSVNMSVPTGFTISGNPITSAGTLALGFNSDYSLPTIASQLEWDQAYDDMIVSASVTGTTTKTLTLNQQDGGTITASWTDYDTAPVTSVFGRTGDIVAQSGDYTTTLVPEGTNLYYTDARSRAAISLTTSGASGPATYNSSTGVLNIPNYSTALSGYVPTSRRLEINGISYDLSADRSWSVGTVTSIATSGPITGGTITGSGTIGITQSGASSDGYLSSTDWNTFNNKQNAITLTTTGTSGPATLIGNTLNIPQYQSVITNPVTGTGTANYVARWTSSSNIGTGVLYDNGVNVGVNTTTPDRSLSVVGTMGVASASNNVPELVFFTHPLFISISSTYKGSSSFVPIFFETGGFERMRITTGGSIGIGTSSPSEKLDVVGNLRLQNSSLGATIYFGSGAGDYLGYYNSDSYYRTVGSHYFEGAGFYKGLWNSIGQLGIGNTNPTQLVDIGISGAQKSLRVRGTYNFDGAYLSSATSNGGGKIEFVAHTGVNTSSAYRIQHDRDQTPDLIFSYAGSAAAYSSLSYSELMRLDPNANLGLGTSAMTVISGYRTFSMDAPSGTFTEYRQNTVNHMRIGADGGRPFIYCESPNPLDIYTGASFTMRLAANGNVGVGTTNPSNKFVVSDGGAIGIEFNPNYLGESYIASYNRSTSSYTNLNLESNNIYFRTGGGAALRGVINSSGDFGIGTTTPTKYMSSTETLMSIVNSNVASLYLYSTTGHLYNMSSISNGDLFWYDVSAGTERMRLTSLGNFGIGTSSPLQKLHVAGNIHMDGSQLRFPVGVNVLTLANVSGAWNSLQTQGINMGDWFSNPSYGDILVGDYSFDVIRTDGTHILKVANNGNVGIGTTAPSVKLEVIGQAFVDKFQYTQGIQINGGDLNDVTTAGFYAGSGMTNAPNAGWFWVTVERHSDAGWVHQVATSYGAGNTENEIYSRTKINGSTWMPWKKIAYSSDVPAATSVYDLLPNARVDFNWVGQVIDGTWVDIFTRANNVLTSGTWMVNMYISDYSTGGEHYQYTYSGTFTWYQGGTNQSGTPSASEIALHRMGHAANSTVLYLRTKEETAADGGNGKFQISANYSHFANTTINFKFVKII